MAWIKHFRKVSAANAAYTAMPVPVSNGAAQSTSSKFSSYLPEVYAGHPSRLQRYFQYDDMDNDSDICAALDTISDFCTQSEEQNEMPFVIHFNEEGNETEVKILQTSLKQWTKLNTFKSRLWYLFRNCIKNGDTFFLRDPETHEWLTIDHNKVEMVRVDNTKGKEPSEYYVRGLDLNKQAKFATKMADMNDLRTPYGTNVAGSGRAGGAASGSGAAAPSGFAMAGQAASQGGGAAMDQLSAVDAEHIIHLSLSVGDDINWPFGASILEAVFKVFKQKELLEDSIIIYRVQRAPERRIFYIDVGSMPPQRAKAHIEQVKNDIHQRRMPNRTAGGGSVMDTAYNPLSILEDYFFAQSAEGRGSKVETLPGGELTGEIGDLLFFSRKLARGLRIPAAYLALDDSEGGQAAYQDGKVSTALIQEFIFNKYCMRIQSLLAPVFDREFKRYLYKSGIEIEDELFELQLCPPQNFSKYRQAEMDAQQVQIYTQLAENKKLSERFKLKRYLNLTEEEMLDNERMWSEENADKLKKRTGSTPAEDAPTDDLGAVGIRGGGGGGDFGFEPPPENEGDMGPEVDGGDPSAGGAPPPDGGGAPPPGPGPAPAPGGM